MNSFASKVKNEISSVKNENLQEATAKLQGMLVFGGKFKDESFLISYENKEVAEKLSSLISFVFPLHVRIYGFHVIFSLAVAVKVPSVSSQSRVP